MPCGWDREVGMWDRASVAHLQRVRGRVALLAREGAMLNGAQRTWWPPRWSVWAAMAWATALHHGASFMAGRHRTTVCEGDGT